MKQLDVDVSPPANMNFCFVFVFHFCFVSVLQKKKCYRPSALGFRTVYQKHKLW